MENGMQLTLDEYAPQIFREQTAGASDFLARTSVQQESKKDFRATVQVCFSELCILSDSSKKKENPLAGGGGVYAYDGTECRERDGIFHDLYRSFRKSSP